MPRFLPPARCRPWRTIAAATVVALPGWAPVAVGGTEAGVAEPARQQQADPQAVPEGSPEDLLKLMRALLGRATEGATREARAADRRRVLEAVVEAAERVERAEPDDRQRTAAWQYRLAALQALESEGAAEPGRLRAAIALARSDPRPSVVRLGIQTEIGPQTTRWQRLSPAERTAFVEDLLAGLEASADVVPQAAASVRLAAALLERRDEAAASGMVARAVEVFAASEHAAIRAAGEELQGLARRLSLHGTVLELQGADLDGVPLDWRAYRGKVVLVDFWAVWCDPCREEIPELLQRYREYRAKGFEVVGISLDARRSDAQRFVADQRIPWKTLFPGEGEPKGWESRLVQYYGISGLPTAFLLDQQGVVVHANARGRVLQQQLQRLLGPPQDRGETPRSPPSPP